MLKMYKVKQHPGTRPMLMTVDVQEIGAGSVVKQKREKGVNVRGRRPPWAGPGLSTGLMHHAHSQCAELFNNT